MAHADLPHTRRKRLEEFVAQFCVKPRSRVKLSRDFDSGFKGGVNKKDCVVLLEIAPRFPEVSQEQRDARDEIEQSPEAEAPEGAVRDLFANNDGASRRHPAREQNGPAEEPA